MIADQNIHPQRQVYYLGAKVIEILNTDESEMDFFYLFQNIKKTEDISVKLFTLTLDWLFLLGVISLNEGRIKKCL